MNDFILSPSGINLYLTCPYSFKLRYVDKLKPIIEDDSALRLGKSVHLVLEKFYGNIDIDTNTPETDFINAMKKTALEHWDKTIDAKKRTEMNNAIYVWLQFEMQRFRNYKEKSILDRFCPVTTEEDITDWQKRIRAIIDKRCIGVNGNKYALDYKTDKKLPALRNFNNDLKKIDTKYKVQSALNAMVLKSQDVTIDNFYFQFIRYPDKLLSVPLTKELYDEVNGYIKEIREAIEYPKNYKSCFYCGMKIHCKTESTTCHCISGDIV